ncbi:hypothetical protein SMD11_4022 [Streptomyces albireticuli]|uniref:Uncharacterized protein n=2 Tax=Streptomyces TaxID=1883 RepID=A0A1Z2L5R2_9ACTN|nr:hypothetical protein SMD11_4022 [Streptomyces albireticuli]MBB5120022.1 hypothetical protein [Streptomyces eurocidicus]
MAIYVTSAAGLRVGPLLALRLWLLQHSRTTLPL